jgi:hypothetical protein
MGLAIIPAARSLQLAATTTDVLLISGRVLLKGWAVRETTGAAVAAFTIRDGLGATGLMVAPVNLAANESSREWFGEAGLVLEGGVFIDVTAGSIEGAVWVIPESRIGRRQTPIVDEELDVFTGAVT